MNTLFTGTMRFTNGWLLILSLLTMGITTSTDIIILFILKEDYLHIRFYSDNTKDNCIASMLLDYDDFAIQYTEGECDILLLSRSGDRVSAEMYFSIKGVIA